MFEDRTDAGIRLSKTLERFNSEDLVVIAIPRGGLPIGVIVAKSLKAPLDVALTKKIGHPQHKEYAIGAVSLEDMVLSDADHVSKKYIELESGRIRKKLRRRHEQYYRNRTPVELEGKTVILVDDGIATGNTLLVTASLVKKKKPARTIVAIPVAPPSAVVRLKASPDIDEVIALMVPDNFYAVGQFYRNFHQVTDEEAIALLETGSSG